MTHTDDKRTNIPTAELASSISTEAKSPLRVAIKRRNPDCDPQLVWSGKDASEELVVFTPPLDIHEKIHSKVLVDDLKRKSEQGDEEDDPQMRLFSDFNGSPDEARSTEFYQHKGNWTNCMILGDSLQVMAYWLNGKDCEAKFSVSTPFMFWQTLSRESKRGGVIAFHKTRQR